MAASDPPQDQTRIGELLQQTFETQNAGALDPALIQLMLELSHAPDEPPPAPAKLPPERTRRRLFRSLFHRR